MWMHNGTMEINMRSCRNEAVQGLIKMEELKEQEEEK
jgi:hypothetical protein